MQQFDYLIKIFIVVSQIIYKYNLKNLGKFYN